MILPRQQQQQKIVPGTITKTKRKKKPGQILQVSTTTITIIDDYWLQKNASDRQKLEQFSSTKKCSSKQQNTRQNS